MPRNAPKNLYPFKIFQVFLSDGKYGIMQSTEQDNLQNITDSKDKNPGFENYTNLFKNFALCVI